jgi:hypothetical protein
MGVTFYLPIYRAFGIIPLPRRIAAGADCGEHLF